MKNYKKAMQDHFVQMCESQILYKTDVTKEDLWETYINSFPEGSNEIYKERKMYDCNSCKQFIRAYGNLVAIVDNELVSIWDTVFEFPFDIVSKKMSMFVKSAKIRDVFLTHEKKLGTDKHITLNEDNSTLTFEHWFLKCPTFSLMKKNDSIGTALGAYRDNKNVFQRGMEEISLDALDTVVDLITQNSIYRGQEHKDNVEMFLKYRREHKTFAFADDTEDRDNWLWHNSQNNRVAKLKNTVIGELLSNISSGMSLDTAVGKYEAMVAPTNYKRPKAIFTKRMIEQAEEKIIELGYENSLGRRHSVIEDVTVNNVLYANRNVVSKLKNSIFDDLKSEVVSKPKSFDKVDEIHIEDFIENILPKTKSLELLMESKHIGNLMSLISPTDITAPSMLKWNNNFSWTYNGDIADSMKQNVKNAGGNIEGILRFSIQWNDELDNPNDFDAHCIEPNGNEIYYTNKGRVHPSSGMLDVDIIQPGNKVAVENITFTDKHKMKNGRYKFLVHNFSHKGGRKGFTAEIEYESQIYSFTYDRELKHKELILVAEIDFNKETGIKFVFSLDSSISSKEIWGVQTNQFTKVNVCMSSPNYWDDQLGIGNKHYFFFLDNCVNKGNPRGFFNEFLKQELNEYRKVFEALGSKMKVDDSLNQLSGLGFSTTVSNSIVARVETSFKQVIKIIF